MVKMPKRRWAKGRSIVHQFSNLTDPLSAEDLKRAVDDFDEKTLIEGHMRLTLQVAACYTRSDPDLISTAMLALVEAVSNWPVARKDSNITPYITVYVHGACQRYLKEDTLIRVPESTQRDHPKKDFSKSYTSAHEPAAAPEFNNLGVEEIDKVMAQLKLSPLEKAVITLRRKGFLDAKIGRVLGFSRTRITETRLAVRERFDELWTP